MILYTDDFDVLRSYSPRRPLGSIRARRNTRVTLVATALNEISTAETLLRGIFKQSRLPDEIILTDTGSEDGTRELLELLAEGSPVPTKILSKPGANIAQGRNLAIAQAQFPIIAVTDFGCILSEDWLENLIAPFEDNPAMQVVFGRAKSVNSKREEVRWILGWRLEQIKPQDHLPSGQSIAFLKQNWEQVGGYPEWLSMTGEDTYFALELKRSTTLWAFVPAALVSWIAPESFSETLQKSYRWSTGDGEAGTNVDSYRWILIKLSYLLFSILVMIFLIFLIVISNLLLIKILAGILLISGFSYSLLQFKKRHSTIKDEITLVAVYSAEILGFLQGLSRRTRVDRKRMEGNRGTIFVLTIVPIDDTGGGARWTQLTLEFLRMQYMVFFINKFPKYETVELHLEFKHPNLVTKSVNDFHWSTIVKKYHPALAGKPIIGIVELPLAEYLPIIGHLHSLNGVVIYDLLDAWDTSLGGQWYNPEIEQQIIDSSDLLLATAPGLAEYLNSRTDTPVHLVPNAVNGYLFNPQRNYSRPEDFPAGDWTIIYVGALWGEWFDWDLLKEIANHYPDASLIVIGDIVGRGTDMPANVHFLGLKPQRDLPAYLHYAQVAILPWKVNSITQMTSPLKVYEYIAMYKPVVAPMIDPLKGIPGVFQVKDELDFIKMVGELRDYHPPKQEIGEFINQNSWQARVDKILRLTNKARDDKKNQE